MCTNWKRFTFKVIMLASLALFLYGCSGGSESAAPVLKDISGTVSDSTTGQTFANAIVTAYAIDANGVVSTTPMSGAESVRSDGQGNFVLKVPKSYTGGIMLKVQATEAGPTLSRAVLPSVVQGQTVAIGLASEMLVRYVEENKAGSFTAANIQKGILVLEPFFGQDFTQVPPPVLGTPPTPAQQQLVVTTQAINSLLVGGTTISDLVVIDPGTNIITLGSGTTLTNLDAAITASSTELIDLGVLPGTFTIPPIVPVVEPADSVVADKTPPSAPQNLSAAVTSSSVTLTWAVATDDATTYAIYRNDIFFNTVVLVPATQQTFVDNTVVSGITYTYVVRARDAAGNISDPGTVTVTTSLDLTHTVSGKVTLTANSGPVDVVISGSGYGKVRTDSAGNYSFSGVRNGRYTVTPTLTGYQFTPAKITFDVTSADVTGIDFVAAAAIPGSVVGGVTYPPGVIIGGITYPSGTVIGGVTYPASTVIGGLVYPTGSVIGGTVYPNGVVIGGVSYPAGTVVGGVAFAPGAVTVGMTYPAGTITTQISNPSGSITPDFGLTTNVIVTGRVTNAGVAFAGVVLTFSNGNPVNDVEATTDSMGYYYVSLPSGGTYTVTTSLTSGTVPVIPPVLTTNLFGQDIVDAAL